MISPDKPLIVIDAGHGGFDNGASYKGRLEKNDNLRLALEVQRQLEAQGIPVLMTRETDVYVPLEDRAAMANAAGADLFISLHRNSYIEQTPWTKGVDNYIYLTAPVETTGAAARLVLDRVVDVGVQRDNGVVRGNYYVLRRTIMPAMLLEMGYIINDIDNQLFDENLVEYAKAIAAGAMEYFGLEFEEPVPPECPACPVCPSLAVYEAQRQINARFGVNMPLTGFFDDATRTATTRALQIALNADFGAGLSVNGILNSETLAAFPNISSGARGDVVFVVQALLIMNGYDPGTLDGIFGANTKTAVQIFQRDNYLTPDGVVGDRTLVALLSA